MRYMIMVKASEYSEAGLTRRSRAYREARAEYRKSLADSGALLLADELEPSAGGFRIVYDGFGGPADMLAGPFPATGDFISEYAMIEADSDGEALDWALRMPVPTGFGPCEVEVRRVEEERSSYRDPRTQAPEDPFERRLGRIDYSF